MTNDSSVPSSGSHDAEAARPNITPRVEARWEKPLISASGGEATLLVRISAATEDETETSRAAPSTSRSSSTAPDRCRAANGPRQGGG